jgi:ribose transport system ATP-binding protein
VARVLVLDEPTASLPVPQIGMLFRAIRQATATGIAVLYVSHNLTEVAEIADEITVLRDGAVVAHEVGAQHHDRLVELIVGREFHDLPTAARAKQETSTAPVVLRARELAGLVVRKATFDVQSGEILGVAGLLGSGREEILGLVAGAIPPTAGSIAIDGRSAWKLTPHDAIREGVAFIAADRKKQSAIPSMNARENITLPRIDSSKILSFLMSGQEKRQAQEWMNKTKVIPADSEKMFSTFSGGNQQKIVMARALRTDPRVLIVDQPVQGVDIENKTVIFNSLLDAARTGKAIVVGSSDPEDLAAICDRVLVFQEGQISVELTGADVTAEKIKWYSLSRSGA